MRGDRSPFAAVAVLGLVAAVAFATGARAAEPPAAAKAEKEAKAMDAKTPASFYDMKTETLAGKPQDLGAYKGKVTLVVNVASECGYTPQYAGLEKLHRELSAKGFEVLGFPSNDFGGQEPGTPEQIQQFCSSKFDVTFPLFAKVQTKAGAGQSPVYAWLGTSGHLPQWNFSKYLIGKDGKVIEFYPSKVTPEAPELREAIDKALAAK